MSPLLALLAAAVGFVVGFVVPAAANPIDVPITISGGGTSSVNCIYAGPQPPGKPQLVMTLDDPANNGFVAYAISGQDSTRFVVNGSEIDVGATTLDAATFSGQVNSIPAVNFTLTCAPP